MPIYVYETVGEPSRQFEVRQSMKDPALVRHPETGEPVRRVISGGYGILEKAGKAAVPKRGGGGCCGGACGCHH
ncbi:MAG: zinc ribbon domain-containing protein [Verrucomicrobiota bacterium]